MKKLFFALFGVAMLTLTSCQPKKVAVAHTPYRTIVTYDITFDVNKADINRELPRVPLRGEGSCGGGGAPRDSGTTSLPAMPPVFSTVTLAVTVSPTDFSTGILSPVSIDSLTDE